MSDQFIGINPAQLIGTIQQEKCVLFLGPEICRSTDGTPLYRLIAEQLVPYAKTHYERDDLFFFDKPIQRSEAWQDVIAPLYQNSAVQEEIYRCLADIPFHLIISLSPDFRLKNTFDQQKLPASFAYFNKDRTDQNVPRPAKDMPVIYNLFGSCEDEDSLILTHDDLFDFLSAIMGQNLLPNTIRTALLPENVRNLIFLGFQLDKWYIQLLLRLLRLSQHRARFRTYAADAVANAEDRAFCVDNFDIIFTTEDSLNLIRTLHEKCKESRIIRTAAPKISYTPEKREYVLEKMKKQDEALQLLNEKIGRLTQAKIIENDVSAKFKLEKELEALTNERRSCEAEYQNTLKQLDAK